MTEHGTSAADGRPVSWLDWSLAPINKLIGRLFKPFIDQQDDLLSDLDAEVKRLSSRQSQLLGIAGDMDMKVLTERLARLEDQCESLLRERLARPGTVTARSA